MPAPFSDLSGFERLQTVVAGEGLFLDTPAGAIDLSRPLTVARYDGGLSIVSRLAAGPVEVVNLMARRDHARIDLRVLRPGDRQQLGPGTHVLYACAGDSAVSIDAAPAELPGDHALRLSGSSDVTCRAGVVVAASVRRGNDA